MSKKECININLSDEKSVRDFMRRQVDDAPLDSLVSCMLFMQALIDYPMEVSKAVRPWIEASVKIRTVGRQ